jgi:hypothetical protein
MYIIRVFHPKYGGYNTYYIMDDVTEYEALIEYERYAQDYDDVTLFKFDGELVRSTCKIG